MSANREKLTYRWEVMDWDALNKHQIKYEGEFKAFYSNHHRIAKAVAKALAEKHIGVTTTRHKEFWHWKRWQGSKRCLYRGTRLMFSLKLTVQ